MPERAGVGRGLRQPGIEPIWERFVGCSREVPARERGCPGVALPDGPRSRGHTGPLARRRAGRGRPTRRRLHGCLARGFCPLRRARSPGWRQRDSGRRGEPVELPLLHVLLAPAACRGTVPVLGFRRAASPAPAPAAGPAGAAGGPGLSWAPVSHSPLQQHRAARGHRAGHEAPGTQRAGVGKGHSLCTALLPPVPAPAGARARGSVSANAL